MTEPIELPMAGVPRERSDAAANRARILVAARRLLAEQGAAGVSMDAVAAAAGVGKGTLFRRFGDRAGLTQALLDDFMREFQDAFLSGPPPLGPGAAPAARLEAFVLALVGLRDEHLQLARLAEAGSEQQVYGILRVHLIALLRALDPALDAELLGGLLLGAVAPHVLHRLREQDGATDAALEAAALRLLRGLTG